MTVVLLLVFGSLPVDAVPALDRLPEPERSCALYRLDRQVSGESEWHEYNAARRRGASSREPLRCLPTDLLESHAIARDSDQSVCGCGRAGFAFAHDRSRNVMTKPAIAASTART